MTTHAITLNLPESLYQHLQRRSECCKRSLEDELLALLTAKTLGSETSPNMPLAYNEVVEFLGSGATAKEITEFRLSSGAQTRAQSLIQKSREDSLSPAEEAELELYTELEDLMALIKIRAHQQLQNHS